MGRCRTMPLGWAWHKSGTDATLLEPQRLGGQWNTALMDRAATRITLLGVGPPNGHANCSTVRTLAEDRVGRSPDREIPKIHMNLLRSPGFHPWTQDRQGTLNSRKPCWTLAVLAIAFDLKIARVRLRAPNGHKPPP